MHLTESKGVVSFMVEIGTIVREGQPLFQICDPVSDTLTTVCSPADGCMCGTLPPNTCTVCSFCFDVVDRYNRERLRFAQPGLWICKVESSCLTCDV